MTADVVLITGASTGLGRATALHLARAGFRVQATMRSPERDGASLRTEAGDCTLTVSQCDVTDAASVERAVGETLAAHGRIDVLVNNAGLGDLGALEQTTDGEVSRMFETNVFGPLRMARAVLPGMRARGSGRIINISSVAGLLVGAGNGLYAGTKHALEAMSETLAIEVRQFGVRVCIIEPGFFATPIIDKAIGAVTGHEEMPYANVDRRMAGIYAGGKAVAGDPAMVAQTIEAAIRAAEPRLRYLIGADARPFVEGRARMTDEEYVQAFGRPMTDEEFFVEFATRFPMG